MTTIDRKATDEQAAVRAQFDATNYASKANLLRVVREEAAALIKLAEVPENWAGGTPCALWEVRDIVGHLIDTTEEYLHRFALAKSGGVAPEPVGLRVMAQLVDEGAKAFRRIPQDELVLRLKTDFNKVMDVFEGLSEADWTGLMVAHRYMGPLPAFLYPVFQLMDYGVHGWDIREGLRMAHGLSADTADLLTPFMFILWQATTDLERCGDVALQVGFRISGRCASTWRANVGKNGYTYEQGPVDDLPTVFEFDPSSLVLTAFGRIRGGTAYGDAEIADNYRGLFFTI